jgi:type IV secretory pathway VirB2 component (pilin)
MKKSLPAKYVLLVAVIAQGLRFLIGGLIGDAFGLLSLVCFVLGIVGLFTKKK